MNSLHRSGQAAINNGPEFPANIVGKDVAFDILFATGAGYSLPMFLAVVSEEKAEIATTAAAFDAEEEDEQGYIELLAWEAECREEYAQACRWGAWA